MIQVDGLKKIYHDSKRGEVVAVNNLQFTCKKGKIFGLLGPNGAGKTTTLRILATMIRPSYGIALVNGINVVQKPEEVRKQIGFLSGETGLYGRFTPRETLRFFGNINGMEKKSIEKKISEIFHAFGMEDFQDVRVDKLSTGMKQKLSIARCILHNPSILILDEPTVGLDIMTARSVTDYVKDFKKKGKCVIYSTHIMREAEKLCDVIGIIHYGKLLAVGTLKELQKRFSLNDLEEIFFKLIEQENTRYEMEKH